MKNFVYKRALSIDEACRLISEKPQKTVILAGGTDILTKMKFKQLEPEIVVSIKGISELSRIDYEAKEGLTLGAMTSLRTIERSSIIREKFSVLSEVASMVGPIQNRNQATLGGNLCNASPASDIAPCLVCLGANVHIVSERSDRWISLGQFLKGPGETALEVGEILQSVLVPNIPPNTAYVYNKEGVRNSMDIAIASVALSLTLGVDDGTCSDVRIVLGAVAPTPIRATEAEKKLSGERINEACIIEAAILASKECRPITDLRASEGYRKTLVRVLTERSLRQAIERFA